MRGDDLKTNRSGPGMSVYARIIGAACSLRGLGHHRGRFPIRTSIYLFFVLSTLVFGSIHTCSADESDGQTPCIILAKAGELYDLELVGRNSSVVHRITFGFNYSQDADARLEVQAPYYKDGSLNILLDSEILCSLEYLGVENYLGDTRARLQVSSTNYFVSVFNIHVTQDSTGFKIPLPFQIVVVICSLLPYFMLVPDALEDLQGQLEEDARGVYGRILSLLLPLVTIALTVLLISGLTLQMG